MGHIYIGYSRKDREVVFQYIERLREEGHEVWVDDQNIEAGAADWWSQIQAAIAEADAYILFLSLASVESQWIRTELNFALNNHKPVIPVLLEHLPLQFLPMQIANIQYVDATQSIETALRQILLALEATVTPRQQARQTAQMPVAPAQARAKSGVNWGVILVVVGVLVAVIALLVQTTSSPDILSPTNTATSSSDSQLSATALVQAVTETAEAQVTSTSTRTATPPPTETPQPQTALALTSEALTPTETLSSITVNDVRQTATVLAQTLIADRLSPTSEGVGGGEKPGLEQIVGTLVAEALRTQSLPSTPISAASAVAATVIAIRATDDAMLSPREAAIIFGNSQNNLLLVSMVAALGVGLATLALTLILIGSGSRLPRRTAHASTSPGTPTASTATPEPLLQEYQIFISSSDKDREWIKVFVDDLQALGYLVWWYAKDAPGLPFGAEIRSAIYYTKVFVVIASPDSMKSKHVEEEVRWAEIYDRPIINVIHRETPVEDWLYGLAKGAAISFTDEREYKGAMEQLTQAIDHLLQKRLAQVSGGAHPPT